MFTTPWIGRLAALLLLLLAIAAAYTFVAEPIIIGYSEADQKIEEVRGQISHYQRLAAMRPALARQVEQSASHGISANYYLSGGTDALAAAGLQDRVNALIAGKGGSLRSVQPMPGVDVQEFRRITVRVQMTGTIEAVFETVYELEAGTPLLFVENLDIQSRLVRQRIEKVGVREVADAPVLTVGFDLSGYMPVENR
jgi:general secretion pathway protein M